MLDHLRFSSVRPDEVLVLVNGAGAVADTLAREGFGVRTWRWDRWKGRIAKNISWALAAWRVRRELKKVRPALVLCNTFPDLWTVGRIAAELGLPLIWRARGDVMPEYREWSPNRQETFRQLVNEHVARVLCTTRHEADELREAGIAASRIEIIHNGIDLERYAGKGAVDVAGVPGEPVLGFAARMVPQKGYEVFFRAVAELQREGLEFSVRIAGDTVLLDEDPDAYRASLVEMTRELGIDDRVEFLGFCEDMPGFMHSIDIFVLASLREPFGTTIVEAMAASLPVVASDLPGPRESVVDTETGYLFEPGDVWDLAEKMSILIRSPDLRRHFGEAGRVRAVQMFDHRENLGHLEAACASAGGWKKDA